MEKVVSRRLRETRMRAGWSQRQLAERLSRRGFPITQAALSKYENGSTIDANDLPLFADVLGVDVCSFFREAEPSTSDAHPTTDYTPTTGDLIYRETLRELLGLEPDEATVIAELAELLKRRRGSGERA